MNQMTEHYPFINPPLPYDYDELEPYIDTKTMQLHHDKHLQTYVNNLNKALKNYPDLHHWTLPQLLYYVDRLPKSIQKTVRDNGGGVYNHIFFFEGMINEDTHAQRNMLYSGISKEFGSIDDFYIKFKNAALSVFGSGYAWLVMNPERKLKIVTSPNQNTPIVNNLCPILALDVWEHAYYLKHYNDRSAYIEDWFPIINWERAEQRYMKCMEEI